MRTTAADWRTGDRAYQRGASRWESRQLTVPSQGRVLAGWPEFVHPISPCPVTSTGSVDPSSDHCPGDPPTAERPEASCSWGLSCRFTRCLMSAIRAAPGAHTRHAHRRAVLSSLAVTTSLPSALKAACHTQAWCPRNSRSACPLATSHRRAVLSPLAVTTSLPSALKAACPTQSWCPCNSRSACPLVTSHRRAVLSSLAVTTSLLSGLKAACPT